MQVLSRMLRPLLIPALALLSALIVGAIVMAFFGDTSGTFAEQLARPLRAYEALFEGAFGSGRGLSTTVRKTVPLLLTGLSVAVAFKAGLFNIGASGQFVMGSVFAVAVGVNFEGMPMVVHLPLAILAGALGGVVWGAIPGILKVYTGAHGVTIQRE